MSGSPWLVQGREWRLDGPARSGQGQRVSDEDREVEVEVQTTGQLVGTYLGFRFDSKCRGG